MNNTFYFDDVTTIEDAKKLFRDLAKLHHPDLGGDSNVFKEIRRQFEVFINNFSNFAFKNKNNKKEYTSEDIFTFKDVLNKIIDFDIEISVIGTWIYAYKSFAYKEQLKNLGFFFSSKHKAWVFNGSTKSTKFKTRLTVNQVKSKYGCIDIKKTEKVSKKLIAK